MLDFDLIQCGLIVLFLMSAGELISHKLKAAIPSILASALLFLALVWTRVLPSDVIESSGLMSLSMIAMMFTIIGMGVSTNPKELLNNWRVVALAAVSYLGQVLILIAVVSLIFDRNTAVGGLPGGAAVALIVQERAKALGLEQIVVQSVLLVSVQGLVACPIVSWMLRKEITRIQHLFSGSHVSQATKSSNVSGDRFSQASKSPKASSDRFSQTSKSSKASDDRFGTSTFRSLFRLYLVAWAASRLELATGISRYVFCLLLGVLAGSLGLLPKDEMDRCKSRGLLSLMMMVTILNGFARATPQMFLELLGPLICILLVDVLSIFLITAFFGKLLHFSRPMRFSIGLNVMIGFPLNLMLAQDLIEFLVSDPQQRSAMNEQIASRMVIAGFTSVTFLSTIGAGLLVQLMRL